MSEPSLRHDGSLSPLLAEQVDVTCDRFESAWKAAATTIERPRIEDYLGAIEEPERSLLLHELIFVDVYYRRLHGEDPQAPDYVTRFPGLGPDLLAGVLAPSLEGDLLARKKEPRCRGEGPKAVHAGQADAPIRLGRYRITAQLGAGSFGIVYKGYDEELRRDVAIKVPHPHRVAHPEDIEAYLTEARVLASLDHPNIVPVHDVGRTDNGLCYIVSKFIEGSNLATKIKQGRLGFAESAALVRVVADALHYAHRPGLVHRDIKPHNILIDTNGKPYVADFGLALREKDFGTGPCFAGTPAYMSPEQARREGHRVDARSDIFSLGVVFYELLTGRAPFGGNGLLEVLQGITTREPCPPHQCDETIPKELERICLKALAKRATDRYTTAKEMADDLRYFLEPPADHEHAVMGASALAAPATPTPAAPDPVRAPRIVPKGLRSFDAGDADFFLELLPGPRDRDGLPESIRFWKTRIERTDAAQTFTAGLIYGPSGCGKSSLVRAGLLPRLADRVFAVYVEATAEETEIRLLKGLRKHCPDLRDDLGLAETLLDLRQRRGIPAGKKVLIILDQFEQWLHAKRGEQDTQLVQALRQCDGARVQCIVLVRDDFWMAATRFMASLELSLVPGENAAAVDLFDPHHAKKVLAAFGRAFEALPERDQELTKQQASFLEQTVAGLAQDGKIISVRLALFAEMVKGKLWTPVTLRDVGGMEGVGVTFLEETFTASTAPPPHRLHQEAARAVLKTLLPETGTDIKGNMRSRQELLLASGYASRPKEFGDLLRILDGELRLLTPTDPECENIGSQPAEAGTGTRYYQLTHDYLVPSLRAWLTRKQKETRQGRAQLRLAERSAFWHAKSENRHLPAWWEWANIRLFTRKQDWTASQRTMMSKATRYHTLRSLVFVALLVLLGWGGMEGFGNLKAHALMERLVDANTSEMPGVLADLAPFRRWLDPLLRKTYAEAEENRDARKQLHVSLALLPVDAGQRDYLYTRLLGAEPNEIRVIRDVLAPHQQALLEPLWSLVKQPPKGLEPQRLRASCALAAYDPNSSRWEQVNKLIAADLARVPAVHLATWMELFRPVRLSLLASLATVFRDSTRRETERSLAVAILADYAADKPDVLADLLMDADEKHFAVLYPKLKEQGERGLPVLTSELDRKLPQDAMEEDREKLAKRQANAAVALLRMNQPEKVWPLLKHSPDPRVRSYLIHRFGPFGVDAGLIVKRLAEEPDVTIRRALILSLGPEQFGEEVWRPEEKKLLVQPLQEIYRMAADPGLHAASEWLLRQWHEHAWLQRAEEAWAKDEEQRGKRLESIQKELNKKANRETSASRATPHWYVTRQGQTMVVIPGPVDSLMGSPPTEAGRSPAEPRHRKRISRTFAIATKPVTVEQFLRFLPKFSHSEMWRYHAPTCPVGGVLWFEAAAYCNWLSDQEGIPKDERSYQTDLQGQVTKLKENYLSRTGYRLATEAEWEFACRAGAVTSRYYGESPELLGQYGWYLQNAKDRTWPVGSKKPNDLGLFDTHGNVFSWCQESYKDYPKVGDDKVFEDEEDVLSIASTTPRVLRGGSFYYPDVLARAATRIWNVPSNRYTYIGFYIARTFR